MGCQLAATAGMSVTATVTKRIGLASMAIFEARFVTEDSRANIVGGLVVMFQIWEMAIIPMLHFKSNKKFISQNYICQDCKPNNTDGEYTDDQNHVLNHCIAYIVI